MRIQTEQSYRKILNQFKNSEISINDFAKGLSKNRVSQFKNALKHFSNISELDELELNKIYNSKKKVSIKKKPFNVKSFWMSINNNRDIKKKIPFRLSALTGLRIGELANLQKKDVTFLDDGRIKVNVIDGKGGKDRTVVSIKKDGYINKHLKDMITGKQEDDNIFYSKDYLHRIAKKHNFTNHDLRKLCIQTIYYNCYEDNEKTIKLIQSYLGHDKKSKTYMYYLSRDINATGTMFDI